MSTPLPDQGPTGPVPPDNRPGHRPEVIPDKPAGPPPTPPDAVPRTTEVGFRFDRALLPASLVAGASPATTGVVIGERELTVRFGLWRVTTPLGNIEQVCVTGPYAWWKVAGGPRLSLADRGLTFATSRRGGVCVVLREPVGLAPGGILKVPSLTFTVEDPVGTAAEIEAAIRRLR